MVNEAVGVRGWNQPFVMSPEPIPQSKAFSFLVCSLAGYPSTIVFLSFERCCSLFGNVLIKICMPVALQPRTSSHWPFSSATSTPYIPTAAISITAWCLTHCQLLLGSQPALCRPCALLPPSLSPSRSLFPSVSLTLCLSRSCSLSFFLSVRKQQPIVRG